jgi:hypothetical protein
MNGNMPPSPGSKTLINETDPFNCYRIEATAGNLNWSFNASSEIGWQEPLPERDCYFLPLIQAEEDHHYFQAMSFNITPPPALFIQSLITTFNTKNNTTCSLTETGRENEAKDKWMSHIRDILDREFSDSPPGETRCWLEREAKEVAAQMGDLYFYVLECTYSGCYTE